MLIRKSGRCVSFVIFKQILKIIFLKTKKIVIKLAAIQVQAICYFKRAEMGLYLNFKV